MDDLRFYILFNSIAVISGRWLGDNERLCAMVPLLVRKIFPSVGLEPETARSGPGCSKLTTSLVNISLNFHFLKYANIFVEKL